MATTDIEPEGESDIFGVPTAVGLWELSEERMTRIEWQRQTDKTDLDPRDGQEKRVWEWVIVKKADVGGAWRAVLKAGFVDATMADTPQVTMIEQAPETDEGRQQCIDAAVDFMIERLSSDVQEPVGGLTDDEENLIEEIIAEENAEEIGGWHQVDPEEGRAGTSYETVRQWANEPETVFVAFGFWEREDDDGERKIGFQSRLTSSDDVAGVPNRPLATTAKGLEATLDRTINWLRSHNPNAARAEFSMTIEGGVVKPIVDIFRRFTGKILLEAQGDGLSLRGSRFNAAVETHIPASAMDSYDVQRQGELVVDSDDWWGTMQQHLYGDDITIEAGETDEGRPFLRTQGHRQHQSDPVIAVRSDMGDFGPDAAGFVTTGSDYEEVLEFAREAPEGDAAFGVLDGVPLIVIEGRPVQPGEGGARLADDDVTEAFRAQFPAKEIHGEAVVAVATDHLQEIRKAMPRPSQTDVEFTIAEDVPLLSEYSIDGVDVDVRIALLDPEKIEDYTLSVPAAEIEVPEGEPAEEEDADEVDEAIEEFAREAVTEGDESEVSIVGTGQDKSVGLHPPPPQEVIDQYPDEKKSDDPEGAFLHELSDVVGQAVDVDKYDNEDVVGTLEYLPGGGWNFHPDPPNLLELPIEPVETTSGLKYTAQRGDVTMAVDDQINTLVEQELGPASRFTEGRRVGTAYVTDVDPFQHRELRDVEVKENLRVEDEDDEFEVEVRVGPSSGSFSRGEPKILFDPSDVAEDAKRTIRGAVREHFSVAQLEEVKEQGGGRVIARATVSADGQVQNIDYEEVDVELTAAIAAEFPDLPLSKAELIAEEFETLADVVEATPEEVMEVKGVGEKTVEKMDLAAADDEGEAAGDEEAEAEAARHDDGEEEAEEAPEPPEDEPDPEETASILVSLIGGSKNYNVPGRLPGSVVDEAIGAARDTLGPPGQFDVNDTVGGVTFRGSQVESVDLEAGREILGQDPDLETAGELIVGAGRLDVPEPPDGWASVHFINRNQANEEGLGDRVVYVSPDRLLTVRLDGTRVSNKWSMRVYGHAEPIPDDPTDEELLFGVGGADSEAEQARITHGNTASAEGQNLLYEKFPTVAEAREMFDGELGEAADEADAEVGADVDAEDEREPEPGDGEREADDTDTGPDDREAAIEKSAPGVEAEIEQEGGEWVVRLTPTPGRTQFADDSVIERSAEELAFVVGNVLELWESAVDRQTIDFDEIEERRREARQQVDFTIPRFPMSDEQRDYRVTIEAPAEGRGDKYISIAPTSIVPKDEQEKVLERLERRIGVDGIAALFAATPRGSGNVIGEATFERDRLKVIDWDMERIEELMEEGQDDAPEDFRKPEIGVESTFSEGDEGEPPSDQVVRTSEVEFPTPESADDARRWIPDAAIADDDEPGSEVVVYHPGALSASEEERLEEMSHEAWDAEEEDDEPPEDFGRTVEGTFSEEVIEAGEMEEEVVEDDGEDLLELPVHVEDNFHDGNLFAPPSNTVRLAVSQQIHHAMVEEVGEAEAFDVDTEVGSAFVTDADDPMDRDFVRVEADAELVEEEEKTVEPPEPQPPDEDLSRLSRAEMHTIIEQATIGTEANVRMVDGNTVGVQVGIDHTFPVSYLTDEGGVEAEVGETRRETVKNAVRRWEEIVDEGSIPPEQVAEVNQKRSALNEQFTLDLPEMDQPTHESLTGGDIERVVEDATQGLDATVVVNTDADSIRIAMEADRSSQADYSGQLAEVQGQASNPWGAIREALELWEAAVEKPTIEIDVVNRRRRRLSREFDAELPQVEDVKEMDERLTGEPAKGEEREVLRGPTEVLDEWGAIMEDLDTVPIQEERLVGQDDSPVPIEVDESFAQTLDENKRTQIEQGLLVHHTEEVHDDVHAFLAQLLGSEPEDFYDGSQPSDLPGYDLYYRFTLTRSSVPGEWTNPRFPPSTLLDILSPLDGDNILVTARGAPLA